MTVERWANDPLAGDAKQRAGKWVAKRYVQRRPLFCAPEAGALEPITIKRIFLKEIR